MSQAVNRIGHKIQWLTNSTKKENENEQDSLLQWKFHVIDSPEPNAFCLPGEQLFFLNLAYIHLLLIFSLGGKVFVCSGLFKVTMMFFISSIRYVDSSMVEHVMRLLWLGASQ